jgi:hypothetical protein
VILDKKRDFFGRPKLLSVAQIAQLARNEECDVFRQLVKGKDLDALDDAAFVKSILTANSDVYFSFCGGEGFQNRLLESDYYWHCFDCRECKRWRQWHCLDCDECQYGSSCRTCSTTDEEERDISVDRDISADSEIMKIILAFKAGITEERRNNRKLRRMEKDKRLEKMMLKEIGIF